MILHENWAAADLAAQRYLTTAGAFRGAFDSIVGSTSLSALSRTNLRLALYDIARTYTESEAVLIADETERVASQSVADARKALGVVTDAPALSDALTEHLSGSGEHLRTEIAIQLERDIVTVEQRLQNMALRARLLRNATGISESAAAIKVRIGEKEDLKFFFRDRAGRRLPTQKYIRMLWRHHLLTTYNEVYLHEMAERGAETAYVVHIDPRHRWHGRKISLAADSDEPGYHDIADEVFHPNSEAIVSARLSVIDDV